MMEHTIKEGSTMIDRTVWWRLNGNLSKIHLVMPKSASEMTACSMPIPYGILGGVKLADMKPWDRFADTDERCQRCLDHEEASS